MNDSRVPASLHVNRPEGVRHVRITQVDIWEDGGELSHRTMRQRPQPWGSWLGGFVLGAFALLIAGSQLSADAPVRDAQGITVALAPVERVRASKPRAVKPKAARAVESAQMRATIDDPLDLTADAALARAFATNEPTEWRSGARYGMVVVGPASIGAGRYCRDVAVLTREDGVADRTLNERRCRDGDGAIRSVAPDVDSVQQAE